MSRPVGNQAGKAAGEARLLYKPCGGAAGV